MSLVPTLKLSLEMTNTLSQIERNGLRINLDTLADIRKQYEEEMQELEDRLMQLARDAMGDTPINLSSPDDRSVLLYSRKVRDKKEWARTFNLGHEMRGSTMKPKQRVRMAEKEFRGTVRRMTDVVYKTKGQQCPKCSGEGRTRALRKDGTPGKAIRVCKVCGGSGVLYVPTGQVAGFKMVPRNTWDTAAAGFRADKVTLEERLDELQGDAREFVSAYTRYNALKTYINTFVEGMENKVIEGAFKFLSSENKISVFIELNKKIDQYADNNIEKSLKLLHKLEFKPFLSVDNQLHQIHYEDLKSRINNNLNYDFIFKNF